MPHTRSLPSTKRTNPQISHDHKDHRLLKKKATISMILSPKSRAGTTPVKKLFNHLQCNSLFFIHFCSAFWSWYPSWRLIRQWQCTLRNLALISRPELHCHDPVWVGPLTSSLLPNPDGILSVEPQISHWWWWCLAALSYLGMEDLGQTIRWCCEWRLITWFWVIFIRSLRHGKVSFRITSTHQDCRLIIGPCCLFCCFKSS